MTLLSFGFRRGVPPDADLVFDVRFLPNPHFVAALRPLDRPQRARRALRPAAPPRAKRFLQLTTSLLKFLLPQYIAEGKTYLTIAIGCTGGRHRSVAIAEALARKLKRVRGIELRVRHRDVLENAGSHDRRNRRAVGVVVVTHGQLATELLNAAEMIVGDLPRLHGRLDRLARRRQRRACGDRDGDREGGRRRPACCC